MITMVPVVTCFAFASVSTFYSKLIAFTVLFRAARVWAPTALYVSFNCFSINYNSFDCLKALLMVFKILLQKVVSFWKMILIVKAVCTSAFIITKAACCKTVTVKFKALGLFAIAGYNICFFFNFFCFWNFDFGSTFNFEWN